MSQPWSLSTIRLDTQVFPIHYKLLYSRHFDMSLYCWKGTGVNNKMKDDWIPAVSCFSFTVLAFYMLAHCHTVMSSWGTLSQVYRAIGDDISMNFTIPLWHVMIKANTWPYLIGNSPFTRSFSSLLEHVARACRQFGTREHSCLLMDIRFRNHWNMSSASCFDDSEWSICSSTGNGTSLLCTLPHNDLF